MAFSDEYFEKNKKDILSNYYHYCEKITYPSPLYCSTKPTNELENNEALDRNRYFWLIISKRKIASTLTFLGGCFAATCI